MNQRITRIFRQVLSEAMKDTFSLEELSALEQFCQVVLKIYLQYAYGPSVRFLHSSISDEEFVRLMDENEWLSSLDSYMSDYQLPYGDLTRIANLGLVQRDGEPEIVILDSGLSQDIYDRYYKRN